MSRQSLRDLILSVFAPGHIGVRPIESCRHARFTRLACHNPATWRGDPHSPDAFVQAWRACVVHKMPGDRPLD